MKGVQGGNEKWDRRFLDLAQHVAYWSKDPSTKVGAVIVRSDRTVASLGFNGFPRGVLDHAGRYDDRDTKYEMVVHAELNSLLSSRESLEGCTLYVTLCHPPNALPQSFSGVSRRWLSSKKKELSDTWEKKFKVAETMFKEAGVSVCVMPYNVTRANDNKETNPRSSLQLQAEKQTARSD